MEQIVRARVLDERGSFGAPQTLDQLSDAAAAAVRAAADRTDDTAEFWVTPGFVDAHAHLSWHAFDEAERGRKDAAETRAETAAALGRVFGAGFTAVRDAGGLSVAELARIREEWAASRPGSGVGTGGLPRTQLAVRMLDRAAADAAGSLEAAVDQALEAGATWVKLVATASVSSPAGAGLDPTFTAAEMQAAVRRAGAAQAQVMVHAWGGEAIDQAIEAGARSIEHGIFLSNEQAQHAADRQMTLVPTLRIYRLVRDMIRQGSLPAAFRARVDEAVGAHPRAVLRARDAGLAIAVGTDSGAPEQHGSGAHEIIALIEAGLTPNEALIAATRSGAELLDLPENHSALVFDRDPRTPGVLSDQVHLRTVWMDEADPSPT